MTGPVIIDSSSIDNYCTEPLRFSGGDLVGLRWPGPFPPRAFLEDAAPRRDSPDPGTETLPKEGPKGLKERRKNLTDVLRRLPPDYADRVHFAHAVCLKFTRQMFPWVRHLADDLVYFETVLHLEPQESYYRDHFVHPLEVGCISAQLLDEVTIGGKPLAEILADGFRELLTKPPNGPVSAFLKDCGLKGTDIAPQWLRKTLWVAALYHDLGYFPQKSGTFFSSRVDRTYPFQMAPSGIASLARKQLEEDLIWRQVEHWRRTVTEFRYFQPEHLFELMAQVDHPAYGAWVVSHLSRSMLQYSAMEPADFCSFQVAAHAILCHDHTGLADRIHAMKPPVANSPKSQGAAPPLFRLRYRENPLAAILVLADHLSEFNRERLVPGKTGERDRITHSVERAFEGVEISCRGKTMEITFLPKDKGGLGDHFKKDKQWFFTCSPERKNAAEPFVDFSDAPFDVCIHLEKRNRKKGSVARK